jgi:hypothetical protein
VSCVNTFQAVLVYLKAGYGPCRTERGTCGINCNNNYLIHMMKGVYVEPESFLLVQLLAYLHKACENKILLFSQALCK